MVILFVSSMPTTSTNSLSYCVILEMFELKTVRSKVMLYPIKIADFLHDTWEISFFYILHPELLECSGTIWYSSGFV